MLELKIGCLSPLYLFCLDCLRSLEILEYSVKFSVVLLFHVALRKPCLLPKHSTCWLWITWEQQFSLTSLVVSKWTSGSLMLPRGMRRCIYSKAALIKQMSFFINVTENNWCLGWKQFSCASSCFLFSYSTAFVDWVYCGLASQSK